MSERTAPMRLERTREALAALASAIKSGEPFTETMVVAVFDAGEELGRAEAVIGAARRFERSLLKDYCGGPSRVALKDALAALAAFGSGEGDTT